MTTHYCNTNPKIREKCKSFNIQPTFNIFCFNIQYWPLFTVVCQAPDSMCPHKDRHIKVEGHSLVNSWFAEL